mgnify:CR=1 FL=1
MCQMRLHIRHDMDGAVRQQVFVFLRIRLHVGRNGVRSKMIQARPFFHNEEGVRPKSFGESNTLAVDDGAVFNAPVFGMNGGNIGVKICLLYTSDAADDP